MSCSVLLPRVTSAKFARIQVCVRIAHNDAQGKTLAENLATVPTLAELGDQDIVFSVAQPRAAPGRHIIVLSGNLCPGGSAVSKLSGKQINVFKGPAIGAAAPRAAATQRSLAVHSSTFRAVPYQANRVVNHALFCH